MMMSYSTDPRGRPFPRYPSPAPSTPRAHGLESAIAKGHRGVVERGSNPSGTATAGDHGELDVLGRATWQTDHGRPLAIHLGGLDEPELGARPPRSEDARAVDLVAAAVQN